MKNGAIAGIQPFASIMPACFPSIGWVYNPLKRSGMLRAVHITACSCAVWAVYATEARAQEEKQQTLAQQMATVCRLTHNATIRQVNIRYIVMAAEAADLFLKENNQARAADATTWVKNLQWANDANLKGLAPDAKDRLGAMQAAYIKERTNAVITGDTACVNDLEVATKMAQQQGDQGSIAEIAKQEDRIKQELSKAGGSSAGPAVAVARATPSGPPAAPQPGAPLSPGSQIVADFYRARADAVKIVNHKYANQSKDAMDLFQAEGNGARAAEAKDWVRRLNWTDDGGNLSGLAPEMGDRLGSLQKNYLKERADAVAAVDKAWLEKVKAAREKATPQNDANGAVALLQTMDLINTELGIKPPPAPQKPPAVALTSNPAPTPASQPGKPADTSHPFGVEADKLQPYIPGN